MGLFPASSGGKKTLKIVQESWGSISIGGAGYVQKNITAIAGYTLVGASLADITSYTGSRQITLDYISSSRVDICGSPNSSVSSIGVDLYYLSDDFNVV